MIYLKSITIKNFLSHSNSHIDFKSQTRLLISGMSGSGKSSIVEAMIWCLYGRGRSDNKNLIKSGTKRAEVILELTGVGDDGKNHAYVITRSTTDNGRQSVDIYHDGQMVPVHGVKETQLWIEQDLLKASYLLFVNSIASPQDNPDNFVKQTASKKKDLLLELASVDNYDVYATLVRDKLTKIENDINLLNSRLSEKESQITEQSKNIVNIAEFQLAKITIEGDIQDIRKKLDTLHLVESKILEDSNNLSSAQNRLDILERNKIILESKKSLKQDQEKSYLDLNEVIIKKGVEDYNNAVSELRVIDETISKEYLAKLEYQQFMSSKPFMVDYGKDMVNIQKQVDLLYTTNDICCPFCGKNNPKLEANVAKQVSILKEQMNDRISNNEKQTSLMLEWELKQSSMIVPEAQNGLQDSRSELLALITSLEHFQSDLARLEAKNTIIDSIRKDIIDILANIEENSLNIISTIKEIDSLRKRVNPDSLITLKNEEKGYLLNVADLESRLHDIIKKVAVSETASQSVIQIKKDINEIQKQISMLTLESSSLILLKDALSPKGIKAIVIDYLVPRLEEKINNILQSLSDFKIQIETQKTGADEGVIVEGLFINIINQEGKLLDYANYSGGEKMKIDYSISEALASLSKIKFRILDETIGGLDDEMLSSFMEILEKMQRGYKQLIAISHIGQVKDLFEDKLTIIKKDGTSNII